MALLHRIKMPFGIVAMVMILLLIPRIFFYPGMAPLGPMFSTPIEATMGIVQKIFYTHIAVDWLAGLGFFISFIFSVLYLIRRNKPQYNPLKYDMIAAVGAELGLVFCSLTLTTGPLWGARAWGTFWDWSEPRLMTFAVLCVVFLAYMVVRAFAGNPQQRATLCAIFAIFGFADVPLVFMSTRIWRTLHPVIITPEGTGLSPSMQITFFLGLAAWTLFFVYIFIKRLELAEMEREVQRLKARILNAEDAEWERQSVSTRAPAAGR